jgi:HAD superfamily hydrolase (TIGR01509 family)
MIKAVIFDLNGIFLQSPKLSDRFAQDFNISTDTFMLELNKIMENVRKPNAQPAFSYWAPILKEWRVPLSESEFWQYWFGAEVVSNRMVAIAQRLKEKNIEVFILSNNFKERAQYYDTYPWIHNCVDKVYFSWQTGFVKPDPKAWEFLLEENKLLPEECVYFDDQQKNLTSAESVGITSYLFEGEDTVETNLEEVLT